MAKRLHFCTALLLSLSVFATGCTVDIQDPNEQEDGTTQPGDPSTTNTAPVIELMGEPVITIPVNSSFLDPGVRATDAEDGDITGAVYSNSMQVNTSQSGRYEITYRVADSAKLESVPVKRLVIVSDPVSESTVPRISRVEWVVVGETGAYLPLSEIDEGGELSLSSVTGELVNIIAQSEGEEVAGSMHFLLTGPIEIDRVENNPAYALANEKTHLNVAAGEFPAGDYTLVVTPYAEANASGDVGVPHMVNFTVKGAEPNKEPEIIVVANNDSYTYQAGSDMQPGQVKAVSENDEYGAGAVFSIAQAPTRGSVSMFDLGFFTYTPQSGFTGTDSFTYQIAQEGKVVSAKVSIKVEGPVVETTSGFTVIKPSADSRLIYVSSSAGSDANTCLAEASPCKTLKAGLAKMRNGYPDHLYLKRGDVWRGERMVNNLPSGRSSSEPAVLTYYGNNGPRPKLENEQTAFNIMKGKIMNFSVIGLEFSAYKMDPSHPEFQKSAEDAKAGIVLLGGNENILFEDNVFNYAEMTLQAWESGSPTNISLRRNIWTGAYTKESLILRNKRPSNLYADGVVGLLIEENVFDYGGWNPLVEGAAGNMFNHNLYIQYSTDGNKLIVRNNIITRASSHGVHGRPGGLFENNFFARNAVSLQMGYNGHPLLAGVKAQAIGNVITEGQSMDKGKDGKSCEGKGLCTSAVWGLIINEPGQGEFLLRNNIVHTLYADQTNGYYDSLQKISISQYSGGQFTYEGNIAWQWAPKDDAGKGFSAPGRTLADYNAYLGGQRDFDEFMGKVKSRPLGSWDVRYTASSVNQYIRQGFN
jgi:hypothetical protein